MVLLKIGVIFSLYERNVAEIGVFHLHSMNRNSKYMPIIFSPYG